MKVPLWLTIFFCLGGSLSLNQVSVYCLCVYICGSSKELGLQNLDSTPEACLGVGKNC